MRGTFHTVGNVNTIEIEQIFLLSVSRLSGTCTNFLELFTQHLWLLLAETISFREPVKRKRKCVLGTASQCGVKEAAGSSACACGCGCVWESKCVSGCRAFREDEVWEKMIIVTKQCAAPAWHTQVSKLKNLLWNSNVLGCCGFYL